MAKGKKKMVDPAEDVEMVDEDIELETEEDTESKPSQKYKFKKGTLICVRTIRDGGNKYTTGDEYKGKDKGIAKRLLERGAIRKV